MLAPEQSSYTSEHLVIKVAIPFRHSHDLYFADEENRLRETGKDLQSEKTMNLGVHPSLLFHSPCDSTIYVLIPKELLYKRILGSATLHFSFSVFEHL